MAEVVYVVDKKYFNLFKTSCYSLIKNSTIDLNIYILTEKNTFSENQKYKIIEYLTKQRKGIKILFIESNKYETWKMNNMLYKSNWYGDSIFLKSCIADAMPSNVDWINYIDCDTLIIKNIDDYLEKTYVNPIAGVLDIYYDKDTNYPYISSAVYKVSLKYWRTNYIQLQFDSMIKENYQYIDQDIINNIFLYNKTILPLKYNMDNRFAEHANTIVSINHACIIHFGGPIKPDSHLHKTNQWHKQWLMYNSEIENLSILEE